MINSIGFLPSGISMENLKSFVLDKDIAESLEYLNIPIVDALEKPCDYDIEESEEIVEEDIMVFCTPNEDDVSFLQFHIQNDECTNMFLHHDAYVFSTITDSEYIEIGGMPYVALSTFENDIMVFDPFVRNPVLPQLLLKGHENAVLSLEYDNGMLLSGSSDSTIIEWDIEKKQIKNQTTTAGPVDRIAIFNSSAMMYSVGNSLYCLEKKIDFEGDIERIKIRDNLVLASDSTGMLKQYDLRNLSDFVAEKKAHEDAITGLDMFKNDIYTASLDGNINILDFSTLDIRSTQDVGEKLFSLKMHDKGFYVYGGEKNELKLSFVDDAH